MKNTNNPSVPRTRLRQFKRPPPKKSINKNVIVRRNSKRYDFEIFAYCSENYLDAYEFVIDSWLATSATKITIYTDFDLKPKNKRIEIINMFPKSEDWIVGTGRRLDIIKHFSEKNKNTGKNVLFMDIDCYIVRDIGYVFSKSFDIGITRLYPRGSYSNKTATAGLWFARMTEGYSKFINDWDKLAKQYYSRGKGIKPHLISYVQYSFTDISHMGIKTKAYNILALEERMYNSEHSVTKDWIDLVKRYGPDILHFKGRRFRKAGIVDQIFKAARVKRNV